MAQGERLRAAGVSPGNMVNAGIADIATARRCLFRTSSSAVTLPTHLRQCPICFEDRADVAALVHLEKQPGDVSSHAMCARCREAYGGEKCPFCKQPLAPAAFTSTSETGTGWERTRGPGAKFRREARARSEEQARSEVRARSEAALSAWRKESNGYREARGVQVWSETQQSWVPRGATLESWQEARREARAFWEAGGLSHPALVNSKAFQLWRESRHRAAMARLRSEVN